MVTAVLWWLGGKLAHALHREEKIEEETLERAHVLRNRLAVFVAGLEGHLYLTYLYPATYPLIHAVSHATGIDLSGMYYGGH